MEPFCHLKRKLFDLCLENDSACMTLAAIRRAVFSLFVLAQNGSKKKEAICLSFLSISFSHLISPV